MLQTVVKRVSLTLLGGWQLVIDDQPAPEPAYEKGRAILAYLANEPNTWHSRDKLSDLLWPDTFKQRANFRQVLSNLRAVLSDKDTDTPILLTRRDAVRLNPDAPLRLDVTEFIKTTPECIQSPTPDQCKDCLARMGRMAELYRGEFMAGFSLPDCPEFENWLQFKREFYHRQALALLEMLADCHEHMRHIQLALTFAQRITDLEPWQEGGHQRVMRLHALNRQSSAALAQYELCRTLLWKDLGVYPSAATQSLYHRISLGEVQPVNKTIQPLAALAAERRQVTVLYCELSVAAVDDPDEAVELLRAPQAHCTRIIEDRFGYIVQAHGGGLLAYFGYPQAREDAPRQAVLAALHICAGVKPATVRIGIHSGLIVTTPDLTRPDTVGQTSDFAIRLRLLAGDGEITLSQNTQKLTGGYFHYSHLGMHTLPGSNRCLEVYRVEGETGVTSRLEAATRLTPWVGRENEVSYLFELWQQAIKGERRAVLIRGEAGMGKSRLIRTLQERLSCKSQQPYPPRPLEEGRGFVAYELRCFPEFSHTPFYPFIVLFESLMAFAPSDAPETRLSKLTDYLTSHCPAAQATVIALLAQLLSLPSEEISEILPQEQKERTLATLLDLLHDLTVRAPVLFILEDLHWLDPSSLELLVLLLAKQQRSPMLALFTARPEFQPPWQANVATTTLELMPLADAEVTKLLDHWGSAITPDVTARIVARADGIPLFAEEMANMPAQTGKPNPFQDIPLTLHDILLARLDSIGEAKRTAQLAATLGREFNREILRRVSSLEASALDRSLQALQQANLLLIVSDTIWQFKHALIQEAAYQSQTKSNRQAAHRRIIQVLQEYYPALVETQPEILAQHCSAAGETCQAIDYWILAGQRAARHSANHEAAMHFTAGLQLLTELPHDATRDRLEFSLCVNLGAVQSAVKGYGSVEAGQAYARALELSEQLDDSPGLFKALWGMWLSSSSRVHHQHSLEIAEKLLHLAERGNDVIQHQQAHYALSNSLLWTGSPNAARPHAEKAMLLYQPSHHDTMVSEFGENAYVTSSVFLSLALWLQGFPDQAQAISQRGLVIAKQLNHAHSLGYTLSGSVLLSRWMKQVETTHLLAEETVAVSQKNGLPLWLGIGIAQLGWARVMRGETEGVAQIQQILDLVSATMSGAELLFLAPLGEALMHLGQWAEALLVLDKSLVVVNEKHDRFLESELYRLKGECLLALNQTDAAEACFNQALTISRQQGAKMLELRTAGSLARLWHQRGKTDDARSLLGKIYHWFSEGFATPDLLAANELLQTLA